MRVIPALSTKIEIAAVGAMSKSVEAVTGPTTRAVPSLLRAWQTFLTVNSELWRAHGPSFSAST